METVHICNNCQLVARSIVDQQIDGRFTSQYWCQNCQIDFYNIDFVDIARIAKGLQITVDVW